MAYKFSVGAYRHSGSLVAEEGLTVDAGGLTVTGDVQLDAGVIGNAELANSSVMFNGVTVALGATGSFGTDAVTEGSGNLYYTDARVHDALSAGAGVTYDNAGEFSISAGAITNDMLSGSIASSKLAELNAFDTGDLAEGSNLYYTDARVHAAVSAGDGLTYDAAGQFAVTSSIAGSGLAWNAGVLSVDTAEIAAGLSGSVEAIVGAFIEGSDFVTFDDVSGTIGVSAAAFTASADAAFDTRLATKDTGDLAEGANLYYTDARARAAVSAVDASGDGSFAYDSSTGVFTYTGPSAAEVRAHFSAVDTNSIDMVYNSASGTIEGVLKLSGSALEVTANGLRIAAAAAGAGLGWNADGTLALLVTGAMAIKNDRVALSSSIAAGGLTAIADVSGAVSQLAIAPLGVTNAMLSGGIENAKLVNNSLTVVAGEALSGGGIVALGSSITLDVEVNGDALEITGDQIALKSQIAGAREFTGNVTIGGDLTVNGTTTYINTTELVVEDALVKIASGSAAFAADQGFQLGDYATLKTAAAVADVGNALSSSLPLVAPSMKAATFYGNLEGAMLLGMETKSANATISKNVTRASANITLTLPSAPVTGQEHRIKCVGAADNVVVEAQAGGTIDGAASIVLESPSAAVSLVWDGSAWMVF